MNDDVWYLTYSTHDAITVIGENIRIMFDAFFLYMYHQARLAPLM